MGNINIWEVIAFIFASAGDSQASRLEGAPLAKLWASRWTIVFLLARLFILAINGLDEGFNANWPDAIRCDVQLRIRRRPNRR